MSQSLYLLRHAKARRWTPGCDDFNRQLNAKGQAHAEALSLWMRDQLPEPDAVLCSSSARTRETVAPILRAWPGIDQRTHYTDAIYEAGAGRLHALADEGFEQVDCILMVGHNPGFENLAMSLLRDDDAQRISRMPTGSLAVIEFSDSYREDAGDGILRHWITRKSLVY